MSDTPVNGTVAPGYEDVIEVFERSFEHGEVGAGVCAYVDGRKVVDLWGGWADEAKTRGWERDTIACIYSAVKGMTATCVHTSSIAVCSTWTNPSPRTGPSSRRRVRRTSPCGCS